MNLETSLESLREDHHERTEHFNRAQARYYEAGADIARIEQSLEHQRERSRQTAAELDQAMANEREQAANWNRMKKSWPRYGKSST